MRTIAVKEPAKDQLPARPTVLQPFPSRVGTYDDEAATRLENKEAIVIAGLSLIGDAGYMVGVIGTMSVITTDDGENHLRGWSLHLNHPDVQFRQLRYFDSSQTDEDIELPLPNCMVYFSSLVDATMTEETADAETLLQIVYFTASFITDEGPPKGIDWPV